MTRKANFSDGNLINVRKPLAAWTRYYYRCPLKKWHTIYPLLQPWRTYISSDSLYNQSLPWRDDSAFLSQSTGDDRNSTFRSGDIYEHRVYIMIFLTNAPVVTHLFNHQSLSRTLERPRNSTRRLAQLSSRSRTSKHIDVSWSTDGPGSNVNSSFSRLQSILALGIPCAVNFTEEQRWSARQC